MGRAQFHFLKQRAGQLAEHGAELQAFSGYLMMHIDVDLADRSLGKLSGGDRDRPQQRAGAGGVRAGTRQTRAQSAGDGEIEGEGIVNPLAIQRAAQRGKNAAVDEAVVFCRGIDGHDQPTLSIENGVGKELDQVGAESGEVRTDDDAGARIKRGGQSEHGALAGGNIGPQFSRALRGRREREQGERGIFGGFGCAGSRFGRDAWPREDETQRGCAGTQLGENLLSASAQVVSRNGAGNADDDVSRSRRAPLVALFLP